MKFAGRKRPGFDEFAAEHTAGLIKLAFMVSGDRDRAEDAAQEALVRAYQRWSRLDNPLAYARRVVVNATRDEWRRLQRASRADDAAGRLALLEEVDDLETSVLQRDALMAAARRAPAPSARGYRTALPHRSQRGRDRCRTRDLGWHRQEPDL